MSVMVLESQAPVEFVPARIEAIRLKMQRPNAELAASLPRKIDGRAADPLLPSVWLDVKLIDEAVASVKLERESETQNHVAD